MSEKGHDGEKDLLSDGGRRPAPLLGGRTGMGSTIQGISGYTGISLDYSDIRQYYGVVIFRYTQLLYEETGQEER